MTSTPTRTRTEVDGRPSLGPLYARAAAGTVLPGGRGGPRELPHREIVRRGVAVDPDHLADYAQACGFRLGDVLPATYPHVLAFPLQVVLMADPAFPLALPGLVHIANRITVHRAIAPTETLDLSVHAERFTAHRSGGRQPADEGRGRRGAQVDLVAAATVDERTVWESRSTYLARGATAPSGIASDWDIPEPQAPTGTATATWRVPADTGRRYAAVSGDVNPIHLYPLTAKAMGFPRAIAHGMWTCARALASLQGRIPDAVQYDVAFRKPLLLPSTVELVTEHRDGGWALAVRSARDPERLHLAATVH